MPKGEDETTWELHDDLLAIDPHAAVASILEADDAIRVRTDRCCPEELEVVNESLAMLTGIVRGCYESKDEWASDIALRTAIALSNQCWNYLAAVWHLIRLGYLGEAHSVRRAWFERATFALLLFVSQDRDLAETWLERGDRPHQKRVHERIRDTMTGGAEWYSSLQEKWKYLNDHTHPHVESLIWRTLQADSEEFERDRRGALADVVGNQPVLGGLVRGSSYQKAALLSLAGEVLFTCKIMLVAASTKDEWAQVVRNVESRRSKLLSNLRPEG